MWITEPPGPSYGSHFNRLRLQPRRIAPGMQTCSHSAVCCRLRCQGLKEVAHVVVVVVSLLTRVTDATRKVAFFPGIHIARPAGACSQCAASRRRRFFLFFATAIAVSTAAASSLGAREVVVKEAS